MMELLWLLLPVAAASGWWASQRSARRSEESRRSQPPGYFKGLNYVLNEQPDKAIDLFTQMLEVDEETVETHLALGNLFRRRGEVERAIRVHQNLIARSNLDPGQRALALLELGQDYLRAGLFDRAENLFNELLEQRHYQEQALQNLRLIYEQEKEWGRCLEIAGRLERLSGEEMAVERAHYHCELAEMACADGQYSKAEELLEQARRCDPSGVRATILLGRMEIERNDHNAAIEVLQKAERQDPSYLSEILPLLVECYHRLEREPELFAYLRELYQRHERLATMVPLTEQIAAWEGPLAAVDFVTGHLVEHPSLEALDQLVKLQAAVAEEPDRPAMQLVHEQMTRLLREQHAYQCKRCGFSARVMHWQCPGCKSWSSIKPVHSLTNNKH